MREVDPKETSRAVSYELFINAPMPMVTFLQTMDITGLVRLSRRGHKLNMLLCWCAVSAAQRVPEFRLLPVGKTLMEYDRIGVNVIVANREGGLSSCDIPFHADLAAFEQDYLALTKRVYETCEDYELKDAMILGTSSLAKYEIDGAVNFYSGIYNNPFLMWGKYQRKGLKKLLRVSFQFHHVQMDGQQACQFLKYMQEEIFRLKKTAG